MDSSVDDRFRELERPLAMRKKDVVLLATVTSFEALSHPGKSDLKQFAELFPPLFAASSDETRRQVVAALSQCSYVPHSIQLFLAEQPIELAALFLTSAALSDEVLIEIAGRCGEAHARAIAKRDNLAPVVVDVLVGLRHDRLHRRNVPGADIAPMQPQPTATLPASPLMPIEEMTGMHDEEQSITPATAAALDAAAANETGVTETGMPETERLDREEKLRQSIKDLARHLNPPESDRQGLRHIQPVEMALFARFARAGEIGLFTTALSYALSCTRWLAERILLDMSGQQLATTLISLGMTNAEASEVLCGIYPHLAAIEGHATRADSLLESLDQRDCDLRVDSWLRADTYSFPAADATAKTRRFNR